VIVMAGERFDVIVIGGGPNGLTCAAYLARAGASVMVLDKRFEWGGTMFTDDYSTPFQYNICQFALPFTASLPPYADLELERLGVRLLEPEVAAAFVPEGQGQPLIVRRDGTGLDQLRELLEAAQQVVPPLLFAPPAPVDQIEQALDHGDGKLLLELAHFTPQGLVETLQDERAAGLVRYLCALAGFGAADQPLGVIGAFALSQLLHPTLVLGGSKSLPIGLFRAGAGAGAQYRTVADVGLIEPGVSGGLRVACQDGREFTARAVVSTLDPKTTFLELVDRGAVPEGVRQGAESWQLDPTGPFTAHFGIKGEPPKLPSEDASLALLQVVGFQDAAAVGEQLDTVGSGRLPQTPAGHLTVTTLHDPTQAAPGPYGPLHTLRFETMTPYEHPDGPWDRQRSEFRSRCWDFAVGHTSGLDQARLLFAFADSPRDLERRFRTARNGSVRQGALVPGQTFAGRPHPDCSTTKTPIEGLYLGGGGVHPGVPGSLAGGYNAASAVCRDLELERWWPEPPILQHAREAGMLPEPATTR
jgi:phytoene dehydrogenase-like protein